MRPSEVAGNLLVDPLLGIGEAERQCINEAPRQLARGIDGWRGPR